MEPPTYLANKNPHPRDKNILFDEGPHIYTIKGDSDYMSVTTWNHSHFAHFEPDKIINKMMASKNWTQSKYYGKTRKEIKKMWSDNGKQASEAGTKMHYDIECYYNDQDVEIEEGCVEWEYFENFERDFGQHMEPYRTEWMVYDEDLRFAGSIDMIFRNKDGTLEIYDWKRCKNIKYTNNYQNGTTNCVKHLQDCNYNHYALQLNTYKALLEKNYGEKINGMYLVCMHPNNTNENYIKIPIPDLQKEVKDLFELRKEMLKDKQLKNKKST